MGSTRSIRLALVVLSIFGVAVAGYLAYAYISDTPVRCSSTGIFSGCGAVQESQYAQFGGIPIPIFGLMFYLFILADQLFLQAWHRRYYAWRSFFWFTTLTGFLFSAYLTFVEAFILEAWCIWCVSSALLSTLIFLVASLLFRAQHQEQQLSGQL